MPLPRPHDLLGLVRDDLRAGLGGPFGSDPELDRDDAGAVFAIEDPDGIPWNEHAAAVPWVWVGRHTGIFDGIRPTGAVVSIHGVTLAQAVEPTEQHRDGIRLHRVVDWLPVYGQLGVQVGGRQTVPPRRP